MNTISKFYGIFFLQESRKVIPGQALLSEKIIQFQLCFQILSNTILSQHCTQTASSDLILKRHSIAGQPFSFRLHKNTILVQHRQGGPHEFFLKNLTKKIVARDSQ